MKTKRKNKWLVPILLLMLGSLNILFGAMQLGTISQGPPPIPDESVTMTYFNMPVPIVLHIISGIIFNLLAPIQFVPIAGRRWAKWHRWSGRLLLPSGVVFSISAIWMNHYYPAYGTFLKYSAIFIFSVLQILSLLIAWRTILMRDVQRHRTWMMRAVAISLGPATQRLFFLPIFFALGAEVFTDLMLGIIIWSGFLINLAVVEWIFWRERRQESNEFDKNLGEAI